MPIYTFGPLGWGLGDGSVTHSRKKKGITETQMFREFSSETCVTCNATQDSYLWWENEHSMTSTCQSHEEASTLMSRGQRCSRIVSTQNMLSTKKRKRIGCWNARTLNEVGRAAILTAEMQRYNLSMLGVSELRWLATED